VLWCITFYVPPIDHERKRDITCRSP